MALQLDARIEERLQEKVASGHYPDTTSALNAALDLLDEYDRFETLRSRIMSGWERVQRGEHVPATQERLDLIEQEARRRLAAGIRPNPDVCPE